MRFVWIFLLVVSSSGCHSWRLASAGPREVIEQQEPNVVRVTSPEGRVTLAGPRIEGDSITGTLPGPRRVVAAIPVDRVRTIEVRALDANKTVPALIGIPFLVFAMPGILYLACCAGGAP